MRLQFPYGVSNKSLTICLLGVARHNGDFPSSFKIYAAFRSPQNKRLMVHNKEEKKHRFM